MRFILAATATLLLATNAAFAQATQVNITDPNSTTRAAHVEPGGRLAVQEAEPNTFFHQTTFHIAGASGCTVIATAPAGRALIVRQVRVNVFADSSPGQGNNVSLYAGGSCSTANEVGDVNPASVGQTIVSFEPGLVIPAGSTMTALALGGVETETFVDGYTVPSTVAQSANVIAPARAARQ
jgi:hypothetical protein